MKKIQSLMIVIFFLMITFGPIPTVTADGDWFVETVDSNGSVGHYNSIAVDSYNRPHISYYDFTNGKLKYAAWTGSGWQKTPVDYAGDSDTSIAIDHNGYPHITYWDGVTDSLKYAVLTNSGWSIEIVAYEGYGYINCLALDSNDNPHISYSDDTWNQLHYMTKIGSQWECYIVDTVCPTFISIDIDNNEEPHISYYDADNNDLKYAKRTGSYPYFSFSKQTVNSTGDVGYFNSIEVDSYNRPHISYAGNSQQGLYYAEWTGTSWEFSTVDSSVGAGMYNSLVLFGPNNQPHISYFHATNGDLKYATRTGSTWSITTVDSVGQVGPFTSIALGSDDQLHISYGTYTPKTLKHASYFIPNQSPDQPCDPFPIDGATDVDVDDVVLSWDCFDPDGDSLKYDVYFGTSSNPPKVISNQSSTSYNPEAMSYFTSYHWKIIAWDEHHFCSEGPVWSFTTADNKPPSEPTINGPTSAKAGKTYTYYFKALDPEEDYIRFRICWGDGTVEQITEYHPSNWEIYTTHTWPRKNSENYHDKYQIWARTEDEYGHNSNWVTQNITMPRYGLPSVLLIRFFDRFSNNFPVLRCLFRNLNV